MNDAVLPPAPADLMRDGLPNLRHGRIHQHPLEQQLRRAVGDRDGQDFARAAAGFGLGFAEHLHHERGLIRWSQDMAAGLVDPSNLCMEISTGDIDDIGFADMFAPPTMRQVLVCDPHELQERRFFK
jgi:hypothetical protein